MMFRLPSVSCIAVSFVLCASLVSTYSFDFTTNPQQCTTLSLQITGSGAPPYSVLIIPYGNSPLANNIEVRTVVSEQFSGDATSLSLPLNYPETSQFVAVVSDSSGFGTGGTSGIMTVGSSTDSSCFNPTQSVHPDFFYNLSPNQFVECNASLLWWDPSTVQGNLNFQGVIPGGDSFSIPVGTLTNAPGNAGTGFNWTPNLLAGTTVLVVAGDQRGLGTGGSSQYVISGGSSSSCISNNSPTSTAGPPAGGIVTASASGGGTGGAVPTSTGGGSSGGGSTSSGNTGGGNTSSGGTSSKELPAIVGGTVGGVAAIIGLGLIVFCIRRNKNKSPNPDAERTANLLDGYPSGEPPQNRHPLPFPEQRPETYYVNSSAISSSFSHSVTRTPSMTPSMTQSMLDPGVRYSMAGSAVLSDALTGSPTQGTTSLNRQSGATSFSDPPSPIRPDHGFGLSVLPEESVTMAESSSSPKQPTLTILRPVNIIQHEDAGIPGGTSKDTHAAEPETIELPPAYTNIS